MPAQCLGSVSECHTCVRQLPFLHETRNADKLQSTPMLIQSLLDFVVEPAHLAMRQPWSAICKPNRHVLLRLDVCAYCNRRMKKYQAWRPLQARGALFIRCMAISPSVDASQLHQSIRDRYQPWHSGIRCSCQLEAVTQDALPMVTAGCAETESSEST